jgi:hypothetical protein
MRADIHDESGATKSSSQRPDTLMQDRICQIDENLLHRTADARPHLPDRRKPLAPHGRTIHWVIRDRVASAASLAMSVIAPKAEVNSEH